MKILLFILLFITTSGFVYAQKQVEQPKTGMPIEKIEADPCFFFATQAKDYFELSKDQLKQINVKWIKSIEVFSADEEDKKKQFGCKGYRSMVFVTVKKKHEAKVMEIVEIPK